MVLGGAVRWRGKLGQAVRRGEESRRGEERRREEGRRETRWRAENASMRKRIVVPCIARSRAPTGIQLTEERGEDIP
jgi:hypothetical protein